MRTALLALLCVALAAPAAADFRTTVTKAEGFTPASIRRVAVVTVECHEVTDCARIEQKVFLEFQGSALGLEVIPEQRIREYLFAHGHTAYDPSLRQALAAEFDLDALAELRIPFAEKGDGFGGHRRSQVKVELALVDPGGKILVHGVGTGRPLNVVTSPERVAGNVVEELVEKIFE
jgi:hypothetical protein